MSTTWKILAFSLAFSLVSLPNRAQEDEGEPETSDENSNETSAEETDRPIAPSTWRPTSGSLYGNTSPQTQTSGGDIELRGAPTQAVEEDDGRTPLLVFDLAYEDGITFREDYQRRFETGFWAAVENSERFRPMSQRNRRRALRDAGVLSLGEIDADRAEQIATQIGVEYYLVPRIEIENRRNYRIVIILGEAGEGESGRTEHAVTSGRVIDTVESRLLRTTREAVANPEN